MIRINGIARSWSILFFSFLCMGWTDAPAPIQALSRSIEFNQTPQRFQLVNGLQEISGLAMASENSVFAHNDEFGIVYEVSLENGEVIAAFALGAITEPGDFEGIASDNGRIYLVTSAGKIYEALIGDHRKRVMFNVFDTGIGSLCEVEGLSRGFEPGSFLVLCKSARIRDVYNTLTIYKWSVLDRRPVTEPWLQIPYAEFLSSDEAEIFRPSALEWDANRKALIVLSAQSRHVAIVSDEGAVLQTDTLSSQFHPQAEGVTITPSGDIVIADEGVRRKPGTISLYKVQR